MNNTLENVNRYVWELVQLGIQAQQEIEKLQKQLEVDDDTQQ